MPAINFNSTLLRLIKDVNEIRATLRRVTVNLPLFDIANENTPAKIVGNQNNYVIGNYDVLRLSSDSDVEITGLRGGIKGRFLEIINVGDGFIKFKNQDGSSDPENRIQTPYDSDISIIKNSRIRFYYDKTTERWTLADEPAIQGRYGRSAFVKNLGAAQAIPNVVVTKINFDTVAFDDWGYWNMANQRFEIPDGERGVYMMFVEGSYSGGTGGTFRSLRWDYAVGGGGITTLSALSVTSVLNSVVRMTLGWIYLFTEDGTYVYPNAVQGSGGDLDWNSASAYFAKIG